MKGFRYNRFYQPGSTLPRNIPIPVTKWKSGHRSFKSYMRNVYIPMLIDHTNDTNPIVYIKHGTVGIAGQMCGICDGLLLSILNNRTFKCFPFLYDLLIVYAPAIQPHLFYFPLFNISYAVSLKKNTGNTCYLVE